MLLTQAPMPSWGELFGGLSRTPPSDSQLVRPWHDKGETAGCLSRSAWSLALIALWRKGDNPAALVSVWIPDYFCNSSLEPLRRTGARIVFYPLTEQLAPDMSAIRVLAADNVPDLFLAVHYFGRPTPMAPLRDFCGGRGTWLIEDAAHVLRPGHGIGANGDFVLYSPHKHLPIPDGAVLVARRGGPAGLSDRDFVAMGSPRTWPSQLAALDRVVGSRRIWGNSSTVWLVKRVLQKLGVRRSVALTPVAEESSSDSATLMALPTPAQSALSRRLLARLIPDLGDVARQRQRHQLLWDDILLTGDPRSPESPAAAERPARRDWTPYLASYQVPPAVAETVNEAWQHRGLPVTTWPDLPPEVTADKERHARAWRLRHSRLYLPVHQTLRARGILKQVGSRRLQRDDDASLTLIWDGASRSQWHAWLMQTEPSTVLQTWAYGEAKAEHSGWKVKRGVFYHGNEPVAFAQVLERRVAAFARVVRINGGPLFVRTAPPSQQHAVWQELARLGNLGRGRVLSVAPGLRLSGSSLAVMAEMNFRRFSRDSWESASVDLGLDLDVLRRKLNGKWRNMLTVAERSGLTIEVGDSDELFDWMMNRYEQLMHEADFRGMSIEFLRTWRKHTGAADRFQILRAVHDGEAVAGVCLARHGLGATYLLGWNGERGRDLRANQYLLWQAIVHLKQSGLGCFDLGGISEEQTPGIAAFKLGLNAERYELVGEYWKW
ncbi:MAG: putative glycosyltransferase [Gemmatimonadetes bacterium]|nr:putative glycosyltransferase [Gemmatimonadota bacterium]